MAFTNFEHTKMYATNEVEEIVAFPNRITIQMIQVYFPSAADTITFTDGVSGGSGETVDDTIIILTAGEDTQTIFVNWSARPRHYFGLKVSAITDAAVLAYVFVA